MCVYCNFGDWTFKYNPPWNPPYPSPYIPLPINPSPVIPWEYQKLKEYYDMLNNIKKLEDQLGCPCEPNKADYLKIISERLETMKPPSESKPDESPDPFPGDNGC